MLKVACFGVLVSVASWAPAAFSQEELLHVHFRGAEGCPGPAEFLTQVRARTERVRFVETSLDAPELAVDAHVEGDRAVGRLRWASEDADRLVTGKTCGDVISALALIVALAVDPAAWPGTGAAVDGATTSLPLAHSGTAEGNEAGPSPETAGLVSTAQKLPDAASPDAREAAPDPGSGRGEPWFGGAGAQGELSRGLGTGAITMMGASLHAEARLGLGTSWRPIVRVSGLFSRSPTVIPDALPNTGAATFTLIAGRVGLCPFEFRPSESFVVRPCATLEVGRLEGTAKPVDNGSITSLRSGRVLRLAPGQSVYGRVRVAGLFWFEGEAGATEPLIRQNFVFSNPRVTVSAAPAVEVAAAIGLGVYFP
jgi:hypothetical protein